MDATSQIVSDRAVEPRVNVPAKTSHRVGSLSSPDAAARRPRNAVDTAHRILEAAITEFADHGFMGARMDVVAKRANVNIRMIYHYYGSKDELYSSVLDRVFSDIRLQESRLCLHNVEPMAAMMRLFDFTFSHFADNPLFIRILMGENLLGARYLARSSRVPQLSSSLLITIADVLARGKEKCLFRDGIDPLQLYVTMVSLSYFHLSNGPTLSLIFQTDLAGITWSKDRLRHASDMLYAYLKPNV